MARSQKASRTLPAIDEQAEARTNKLAAAQAAINDIVQGLHDAERVRDDAKSAWENESNAVVGKTEAAYIALAAAAHEHNLTAEQCSECLQIALVKFYGNRASETIGAVAKLRSELRAAMHPNVRAKVEEIMEPWTLAWNTEQIALGKDKKAKTPIRDKFSSRHNAITQALRLAAGKPAKMGKGKNAHKIVEPEVPSFVVNDKKGVLSWVSAHPRAQRGATAGGASASELTITVSADLAPRKAAESKVAQLLKAVQLVADEYKGATDCFLPVLEALRKCTGDIMVPIPPASPAPQPKPETVLQVAEPVQGAADLDDAIGEPIAALRERVALMREMKELSGK